jgi:hypothetical protein
MVQGFFKGLAILLLAIGLFADLCVIEQIKDIEPLRAQSIFVFSAGLFLASIASLLITILWNKK